MQSRYQAIGIHAVYVLVAHRDSNLQVWRIYLAILRQWQSIRFYICELRQESNLGNHARPHNKGKNRILGSAHLPPKVGLLIQNRRHGSEDSCHCAWKYSKLVGYPC